VLDRVTGAIAHRTFADLPSLLSPADVLVVNDVRVRHARLWARDAEERIVEIFLLESLDADRRRWLALARPGRRAKRGRPVRLPGEVPALVSEVRDDGRREILADRPLDDEYLQRFGSVPLPPYIRRGAGEPDRPEDREAYQTVFARSPLAVAAPTAGLHFTDAILAAIRGRGVAIAHLTLAVGAGTFKPVTSDEIEAHSMDFESVTIPAGTRAAARRARASGGRVAAVGTTVVRSLEAAVRLSDASEQGDLTFRTDLFVSPGFNFRAVDALLTNFHLPRSTLLMLVSAFAGRERVLAAYEEAVREGYLFYSFGDAMWIS